MIEVSIILPNFNHFHFLPKRLDSILNQTYQAFELIILDDGSTDNSSNFLEAYRDHPKVSHLILNEKNSGSTFRQWKKGIELAKGHWIWIAESDDYCEPNLLEVLVSQIKSCNTTILSYCQSYEVDESGSIVRDMTFHTDALSIDHWKKDYCSSGTEEIKNFLLYRNTIPNASAVLFKKSAYLHANRAFEQMKLCGDWMLWIQLLKQGNIAFSAKALNYFRAHSATTRILDSYEKKKRRMEEEYQIVSEIFKIFGDNYKIDVKKRMGNIMQEYITYYKSTELLQRCFFPTVQEKRIPLGLMLSLYLKNKKQQFYSYIKR
jgi:glycosyltransferase involved in cell wall biosynthesis